MKQKYYLLVEFPYPSGDGLHMGHAFTFTYADVLARKKRLEGLEVMFPMGWDAFGLPTENYAVKTGIKPQIVTKNNTENFKKQMISLGLSFDWDREINTTDPNYYKWTQWIFLQMFKHGLAYKAATPVGWCPSCKIVLANEEIINDKCERCGTSAEQKTQSQWVLRITSYADRLDKELDTVDYSNHIKTSQRNWIGKKTGAIIKFVIARTHDRSRGTKQSSLEIFTTRPETISGATFVALSPNHPFVDVILEERSDDRILKEKILSLRSKMTSEGVNTGYKVINPETKQEIPVFVDEYVVDSVGTGAIMGVPAHDDRDLAFAKKHNLPIVPVSSSPHSYATPKTIYHLRDWIFSRQHYWGEPTPMIYCDQCHSKGITWWDTEEGKNFKPLFNPKAPEHFDNQESPVDLAGWFPMKEEDLPLTLPDVEKYQPSDDGTSPLAAITNWVNTTCPHCGLAAIRETDVMPNWAGSSWYYIRYCDPTNSSNLSNWSNLTNWLPVNLYLGGAEHTTLHLLYSRFWHKFLNDLKIVPGIEPYQARRQHGMILAQDGSKMSKSKGNVINPNDLIAKYGADAVRTYICFMGPYDQTMPWNTKGIDGVIRFLKRVEAIYQSKNKIANETSPHLKAQLAKTIKRVSEGVDNLKHNVAVAALMEFLNAWEKEGVLTPDDTKKYLSMLSIFAPNLTNSTNLSNLSNWPHPEAVEDSTTLVISINGKTRSTLEISNQKGQVIEKEELISEAKSDEKVGKYLLNQTVKNVIYVPGKILNFVT